MAFLHNFLKLPTHFPRPFENTDGLTIFKGNGKFVNSADASATANHCVSAASEQKIAPRIAEAGVHNEVHIIQRQFVNFYMLFFRSSRRYAYRYTTCFFYAHGHPKRKSGRRSSDEHCALPGNLSAK